MSPRAGRRRAWRRLLALPALLLALAARADERLAADLANLAPQRPGHPDLFVLAVAGDGSERVFRNEVLHLERLAATRLDAAGHVLVLANHPPSDGVRRYPRASEETIRTALAGLGQRMDPAEDLLLLYVTTHGTEAHELVLLTPGRAPQLMAPAALRDALDDAGIGWRVIVISACYSGGFIDTLRSPKTLVITAARADRTSFGCGNSANATWFGQAFLIDGLNHTASFRRAFLRARNQIAEQEKAEDVDPSEPQWLAGEAIGSQLAKWLEQLPPGTPATFVPSIQVIADPPASASDAGHRP